MTGAGPVGGGALVAYSIRLLDTSKRTIVAYRAMCRDDEGAKSNRRGITDVPYASFTITRGDTLVASGDRAVLRA